MPDATDKPALRIRYRALRNAIPPEARVARSRGMVEQVLALPRLVAAESVFCYASAGGEVQTLGLIAQLLAAGKTVAVPLVGETPGLMEAMIVRDVSGLVAGRFGVPTPVGRERLETTPDLTLVPGLAFTRDGRRLGQGGGYYDRYLAQHASTFAVGLCFTEQLAGELPCEPHDARVSIVIDG